MTEDKKYSIAVNLINQGYIIHCTNTVFDLFDPNYIQGGSRAKEGYGFYFSDMPYKSITYGDIFKVVKKDAFNFIDYRTPIPAKLYEDPIRVEIARLEQLLETVRNNREYDEITNEIENLQNELESFGGDRFFRLLQKTIRENNLTTIGQLEYYVPDPKTNCPKITKLLQRYGFDGYEADGIYTIFNFKKLNRLVQTVDLNQYLKESISFDSFQIKDNLNPNFWKDEKLDSRIRLKLLDIADDFTDFLKVDWAKPKDIVITGSIANYNWSEKFSDIDLHVIFDFKEVDERTNFVKNYFDAKKNLWNQQHQDIKIYGFNVEVYVQDKNEKHTSSGVYSLEENKWIVKPIPIKQIKQVTLQTAKQDADKWQSKIDKLIQQYDNSMIDSQKERLMDKLDNTMKNIKSYRQKAMAKSNVETNKNNLAFKMLRRNGTIGRLLDKKTEIYNNLMSLNKTKK
jgi:hypothetical protein